jgi:hypothetical protein
MRRIDSKYLGGTTVLRGLTDFGMREFTAFTNAGRRALRLVVRA